MRFLNFLPIDAAASNVNTDSDIIDLNQVIKLSAQVIAGAGTIGGTLQLQVSNDVPPPGTGNMALASGYAPTNWGNLGSPVTVSSSGSQVIGQADMCYRWLRAVYTDTVAVASDVTCTGDTAGSLNNKYFLFSNGATSYYVWYNINSAGVDPMIAGRTGIAVAAATGANANTIATATRSALSAAVDTTITGATSHAIITCNNAGPAEAAHDGTAATGFTFSSNDPTALLSVEIMALSL